MTRTGRTSVPRLGEASRFARALRSAVLLLALTLSTTMPACTFERRAESAASDDGTPASDASEPELTQMSIADAEERARSVVERFREAVAVGDLSPALSLLDGDATLVDAEAGRASEAASRGEFLLELRGRHMAGMQFEPIETRVAVQGEESALVFTLLAMLEEGEDGIGQEVGRVFESVVLGADGDGGWRIRHLHRSLAPEP